MPTSADAPGEIRFTHLAIAVREDAAYGQPTLLAPPEEPPTDDPASRVTITLRFEARRGPSAPVSFTFYPEAATGTAPGLRIPADCIASLTRTQHSRSRHGQESAPGIDWVRRELGHPRIVLTRLQFRLRSHGQLVHPASSLPDDLAVLTSLAEACVFSVYMPHHAFSRATYQGFYQALRPYLDPPAAPRPDFEPEPPPYSTAGETSRKGKEADSAVKTGGVVQGDRTKTAGEASASRPENSLRPEHVDAEEAPSSVIGSDNDTVAVTTPSGFDSTDDGHLPEYANSKRRDFTKAPKVVDAGKRSFYSNSSDDTADSRRRRQTKRPRWSPKPDVFFESEPSSPGPHVGPPNLPPGGEPAAAVPLDLHQRVARLEHANRALVRQNKMLLERVEELECLALEVEELEGRLDAAGEEQHALEERVTGAEVHHLELDEDCARLGRELAAERDESKEEMYDYVEDRLEEYMEKALQDFRVELKSKLRRLLDD